MLFGLLSKMLSHFFCRLLLASTVCSPQLLSDVFACFPLARQVTSGVQALALAAVEHPSMCQRHLKRKLKTALVVAPHVAVFPRTVLHHSAAYRTFMLTVAGSSKTETAQEDSDVEP